MKFLFCLSAAYCYGKKRKRKVGRPPGGHTNLENGPKRPGKKAKHRTSSSHLLIRSSKPARNDSDEAAVCSTLGGADGGNQDDDDGFHDDDDGGNHDDAKSTATTGTTTSRDSRESTQAGNGAKRPRKREKRKYQRQPLPPPSDIRTRGAKLPRFTFERKTHQKIMLSKSDIPAPRPAEIGQQRHRVRESESFKRKMRFIPIRIWMTIFSLLTGDYVCPMFTRQLTFTWLLRATIYLGISVCRTVGDARIQFS